MKALHTYSANFSQLMQKVLIQVLLPLKSFSSNESFASSISLNLFSDSMFKIYKVDKISLVILCPSRTNWKSFSRVERKRSFTVGLLNKFTFPLHPIHSC